MRSMRSAAILFMLIAPAACGESAAGSPADASSAPADTGARPVEAGAIDGSSNADADADLDVDADGGVSGSRCTIAGDAITCDHQTTTVHGRTVAYAVPLGAAPAAGWPAVLYFQGSFVPGDQGFAAHVSDTFGRYALTLTIKSLLDRGYAVIGPDASANGGTFWQTNIPPYDVSWTGSDDDLLMQAIFAAFASGEFGPVDASRLYAMGISSGGFMTSRMAVSYRGKFRALADCSGSYARCSATCSVPTPLPSDHPPTLFLHGAMDTVVPTSSAQPYLDALTAEGHEAMLVSDPDAGHEWLRAGPDAIPSWFDSHP